MGDMADYFLDQLYEEDEIQLNGLGNSIVFWKPPHVSKACPACGSEMIYRNGKFGLFAGCSNFPECKDGPTVGMNEPNLSDEDLDKLNRL